MPWGELGGILLVLAVMVAFGNFWFYTVEAVLKRIKRLFTRHKEPPSWHPFPPEQEDHNDV